MALLFMDGFSGGDGSTKWDLNSGSRQTLSPRTAGSTYISTSSNLRKMVPATAEMYVGFGYNTTATFQVNFMGDSANTTHVTFQYTSATKLWTLYRGTTAGTLLATGTAMTLLNTWHYAEMHVKISDTVGVAELRIDGVTTNDIAFSGDTKNAGTNISVDTFNLAQNGSIAFADFYMCDATGSRNNTWLGDVVVRTLTPNGNGAFSQLVGSDSDSVNNYLLVNEQPVSSTQYTGSPTTGQHDSYTMSDLPAGVSNVFGVQLNSYIAKSDASAASAKPMLRTNSTNYYGTTRVLGTSYQTYSDMFDANPNTSTGWTVTDVNGLETGMEVG